LTRIIRRRRAAQLEREDLCYGADKNGDWEYASYSPEGELVTDAAASLACAKCHLRAGTEKDFVYVGRFPAAQ
jgi:hypothetical protein